MSGLVPALLGGHELTQLVSRWGYGLVLAVVALQSLGVPLPGTTALIAAALLAATTHRLAIAGVLGAAMAGVLLGSLIAYAAGRRGGVRLLERHGHRVRLTPERVARARAGFRSHDVQLVFAGRFVTGLRNTVALLAGASGMPLRRFGVSCIAAALVWTLWHGLGSYLFGRAIAHASTALTVVLAILLALSLVGSATILRRSWRALASGAPGHDGDP
jgi:membrane protein DedA with SNARE-associated domain